MRVDVIELSKRFNSKVLFEDFSINFESGSITIIMGESGYGKTTLLNMIGTIEPFEGEIRYDGKQLNNKKDVANFRRNDISFIFQNYGLIDNETVYQNFSVIQSYNVKDLESADAALEMVGLEGFGKRMVYELSGGEQQRVAIAKAILKDPKLILADEPTASIDESNKEIVLNLLSKLNEKGKTIIIVTHDPKLKEYFVDANIVYL